MSQDDSSQPKPVVVQLVAAALVASIGVYVAIGIALVHLGIIQPAIDPNLAAQLGILFGAVGPLLAFASLPLRHAMLARSERTLADKMRITIVCIAIADTSGVLGLVHAILSGALGVAFILWGASFGAAVLQFPTRAWLLEGTEADARPIE